MQEHFPELVDRTAAGLFRGSQVLGAEDVLSRDHGRGPMFLLLLIQQDYAAQGQVLKQAMVGAAPQEWLVYRYCGGLTTNIEVSNPGPILPCAGLAGVVGAARAAAEGRFDQRKEGALSAKPWRPGRRRAGRLACGPRPKNEFARFQGQSRQNLATSNSARPRKIDSSSVA